MKNRQRLRPWELALMLALCFTLLTGAWAQNARTAGWWCVMFPPLTPRAVQTMASPGSGESGEYEIRFRILELWDELTGKEGPKSS